MSKAEAKQRCLELLEDFPESRIERLVEYMEEEHDFFKDSTTPELDSLVGLLRGMNVKTKEEIRAMRLGV